MKIEITPAQLGWIKEALRRRANDIEEDYNLDIFGDTLRKYRETLATLERQTPPWED